MLSTANSTKAMYPTKRITGKVPMSSKGITASPQLRPLVTDMNRVIILRGKLDQYLMSAGDSTPFPMRFMMTDCVNKIANKYMMRHKRRTAHSNGFKVLINWWTIVRKARMKRITRIILTTLITRDILTMRKILNWVVLWLSTLPFCGSPLAPRAIVAPASTREVITTSTSSTFQCHMSGSQKKCKRWQYTFKMSSIVNKIAKTLLKLSKSRMWSSSGSSCEAKSV
mmetsp:Transcript_67159/g.194183  ORF Transcript_67159/g.194183 Transcript_67159/m.194183 type:complete len:226 (+) Transcript_67159:620-1297(+)